jgi:Zn-dependent protease
MGGICPPLGEADMLTNFDPATWIFRAMAVLFALSAHEFAHASVSLAMGDMQQRIRGRLTLNPLAHLDPIGTIMLLIGPIGWAKPVQIDPRAYRNPRLGLILTSLAGPGMNILLAVLFAVIYRFAHVSGGPWLQFIQVNFGVNIGLAAFNLVPIPPLDGSKVLASLLPRRAAYSFMQLEPWGPFLLMFLLFTGTATVLISPIYNLLFRAISGVVFR